MIFTFDLLTTGLRGMGDNRIKFHRHTPVLCGAKIGGDYTFSKDIKRYKTLFERKHNVWIGFDCVDVITLLKLEGIEVNCKIIDVAVMLNLFDENLKTSTLDYYTEFYFKKVPDVAERWLRKNKYTVGLREEDDRSFYDKVPVDLLKNKLGNRIRYTAKLYKMSLPYIKEWRMWPLARKESELQKCLADMKFRGVKIDREYFEKLEIELGLKLFDLKKSIYSMVGYGFSIDSNKELGGALKSIGIKPETKKIVRKNSRKVEVNYCLGDKELRDISHPIVELIMKHRYYSKQYKSYVQNWLGFLDENDVIHCDLISTTAVTGRFSSRSPNMQNVEKGGRKKKTFEYDPKIIRRAVINRPGYYNFFIDFQQMEYKVLVAYSKDEECLRRVAAGEDFHQVVADIMGIERAPAKDTNFGILYGMGDAALAERLGVSLEEAKALRKKYMSYFPTLAAFVKSVKKVCRQRGYVFNKFKRRRRLESDKVFKAVNAIIQGCCADIIKVRCMLAVWKLLKPYKSNMLLMIHDELVIEFHKSELHLVKEVKRIMEEQKEILGIDLPVDVEYAADGKNAPGSWANLSVWEG